MAVLGRAPHRGRPPGCRSAPCELRAIQKQSGPQRGLDRYGAEIEIETVLRSSKLATPAALAHAPRRGHQERRRNHRRATSPAIVAARKAGLPGAVSDPFNQHADADGYLSPCQLSGVLGARVRGERGTLPTDTPPTSLAESRQEITCQHRSSEKRALRARHVHRLCNVALLLRHHQQVDKVTNSQRSPRSREYFRQVDDQILSPARVGYRDVSRETSRDVLVAARTSEGRHSLHLSRWRIGDRTQRPSNIRTFQVLRSLALWRVLSRGG